MMGRAPYGNRSCAWIKTDTWMDGAYSVSRLRSNLNSNVLKNRSRKAEPKMKPPTSPSSRPRLFRSCAHQILPSQTVYLNLHSTQSPVSLLIILSLRIHTPDTHQTWAHRNYRMAPAQWRRRGHACSRLSVASLLAGYCSPLTNRTSNGPRKRYIK